MVGMMSGAATQVAAAAVDTEICVQNEAVAVLKVCEESHDCQEGVVTGKKVVFPGPPKYQTKTLNIFYSTGIQYKHWQNVALKRAQAFIVEGKGTDLSGKVVDNACPGGALEKG